MHNWRRYFSSNCYEIGQKRGYKFGALLWRDRDATEKNRNIAQLQSIMYTTAQKRFWINYFL